MSDTDKRPIQVKLPRSRVTLTYRTVIDGKPADVKLPFRILVLGDFSLGQSHSPDHTKRLADRRIRSINGSNLNTTMRNMEIKLPLAKGTSRSQPEDQETRTELDGLTANEIILPIDSMESFGPAAVAQAVPEIRRQLVLKEQLLERFQKRLNNNPELKEHISKIYGKDNLGKVKKFFLDLGVASAGYVAEPKAPEGVTSTDGAKALLSEVLRLAAIPELPADWDTKPIKPSSKFAGALEQFQKATAPDALKTFQAGALDAERKAVTNALGSAASLDDAGKKKVQDALTTLGEIPALAGPLQAALSAAGPIAERALLQSKRASAVLTWLQAAIEGTGVITAAFLKLLDGAIAAAASEAALKTALEALKAAAQGGAIKSLDDVKKDVSELLAEVKPSFSFISLDEPDPAASGARAQAAHAASSEALKSATELGQRVIERLKAADPSDATKTTDPPTAALPTQEPSLMEEALSRLAALVLNVEPDNNRYSKVKLEERLEEIQSSVSRQINGILHHPDFQAVESTWRSIDYLVGEIDFSTDITLDILDVSKEEIREDFENNPSRDVFNGFNGVLYSKLYLSEYDQYGGLPFGALIGLYEFDNNGADIEWLTSMGRLANACHAPFIGSIGYKFFLGREGSIDKMGTMTDLRGHLEEPLFDRFKTLRNLPEAAYIGLTFPRYVQRRPYDQQRNEVRGLRFFSEDLAQTGKPDHDPGKYLWGNSAALVARNLARSFAATGWCQFIRGHRGGGLIERLPRDRYQLRGQDEWMLPVELVIPDFRELEFAEGGFIPLVYRKYSSDATFFSVQSLKTQEELANPKDSENAQLVRNLAYTFSVTRIAHYFKTLLRNNVGTNADAVYIQRELEKWLFGFVTTVVDPDDETLLRYPFKAAQVSVDPIEGHIGWFDCKASILPHVQFEGINVELRVETRLNVSK